MNFFLIFLRDEKEEFFRIPPRVRVAGLPCYNWDMACIITLSQENIDVSDLNCFLDYFSTGNINLSGNNVLLMLSLSNKYDVPKLEDQCLQFLKENLDPDNFIDILSFAIEHQHTDLKWICFSFAINNETKIDSLLQKQKLVNKPIPLAIMQMIDIAKYFKDNSIQIVDTASSWIPTIRILDGSNLVPWKFLDEMSQLLPVVKLEVSKKRNIDLLLKFVKRHPNLLYLDLDISPDINDNKLEELAKNLRRINSFFVERAIITTIPYSIANQAKRLCCSRCTMLTELSAPQAEILDCTSAPCLQRLAPL